MGNSKAYENIFYLLKEQFVRYSRNFGLKHEKNVLTLATVILKERYFPHIHLTDCFL